MDLFKANAQVSARYPHKTKQSLIRMKHLVHGKITPYIKEIALRYLSERRLVHINTLQGHEN